MSQRPPSTPRPLDRDALNRLAITYVGRYATTRAKLASYLARKLRERGWAESDPPQIETLVEQMAALGYVDDRAFAEARAGALTRRGFGARRVGDALRSAGIAEDDAAEARESATLAAWDTAVRFARRRQIGPFARDAMSPDQQRRALAAMMRAGHAMDVSRRLVRARPGEEPTSDT